MVKSYIITIILVFLCHNALAKPSCDAIGQQGVWLRAGDMKLEHLGLLTTDDGDYFLADIILPFSDQTLRTESEAFITEWLSKRRIHLKLARYKPDRYGRCSVLIMDAKQMKSGMASTLQVVMLRAGLGFANPNSWRATKFEIRNIFLNAEQEARNNHKGLWKNHKIISNDNAIDNIGSYSIIEGKPKHIAEIKGHLFLNFGEDWRNDFTVFIPSSQKDMVFKDIDKDSLIGKKLQVRGVVYERNGASISIRYPHQIMVLKSE